MKAITKRSISVILALVMCFTVLFGINMPAYAANVDYVYDGNKIYNWGTREEEATFLSQNAISFYEDNNTSYAELTALLGSSNESSVPSSQLYMELQSLMKSNHSYINNYDAIKTLCKYTDCQNSGGKISSFYSGVGIGPSWDGGWNREHTWPNSKGDLSGSGENDIMMIRPTSTSENSSRGNKAYGNSTTSTYFNPNNFANGNYDLRGDVARIILYQYVRWGCTNTGSKYNPNGIFGSEGVIESKAVLLDWIEEDPVDTWELGRNDSVESITGTRNVFVDYPELAFDLFDEQIPENMTTPSGYYSGGNNDDNNGSGDSGDDTPDVPEEPGIVVIDNPVANTAYKFGMVQSNVGSSVYYLSGGMVQTYYFATNDDEASAIDVYLEATNGGYYLYTDYTGQKQYINMVTSADGEHVNGVYESTASTVYTYDSASKTIIANVTCKGKTEPYWFGTRNDRNYTTVGPCATSYNGFYCQFYGMVDDGSSGGDSGGDVEIPDNWVISVSKTGVYSLRPNSNYTANFSADDIDVFDAARNVVKYNQEHGGFPLVAGQEYTVTFKTDPSQDISGAIVWLKTKVTEKIFSDVPTSEWYNDAVTYSVGRGIISGYGGTTKFGPGDNIQRQDFLVILARLDGVDLTSYGNKKSAFPDVPEGSYYEAAVNWGSEKGIVSGYHNGKFGVGDKITREQLVTFLYRYAGYKGLNTSYTTTQKNKVKNAYIDYKNVTDYAQDPVIWAVTNSVINGKTPTTIVPGGNALRCEVAQIMYNIFKNDILN